MTRPAPSPSHLLPSHRRYLSDLRPSVFPLAFSCRYTSIFLHLSFTCWLPILPTPLRTRALPLPYLLQLPYLVDLSLFLGRSPRIPAPTDDLAQAATFLKADPQVRGGEWYLVGVNGKEGT